MQSFDIYRHDTEWDWCVQHRGAACGYTYKLESMLRPGSGASVAFKQGVTIQYVDTIGGCAGYRVTLPDETSHIIRCYRGLQDVVQDVAAYLPHGMEEALGNWHAIKIRRYGESGDIQDLLSDLSVSGENP